MKKKLVLKNKKRFAAFLILVTLITVSFIQVSRVYGYKELSFKTVTVRYGDTLWDIAGDNVKNKDIRKYLYDIKQANKLNGNEIYPGDKLIIPES